MYIRSIEQCIMGYAIRYERLGEMIKDLFSDNKYSSSTKINLFIPLTELAHSLESITEGLHEIPISAAVLNLCAHYKNFFKKGYGVDCTIYLIQSTEEYRYNKTYYLDYKHKSDRRISSHIDLAWVLISTICPYLNGVQFLTTPHESALLMMDIDNYTGSSANNIPNLVLSKDLYNSQLTTVSSTPGAYEFIMLRPSKSNGKELSYYVTRNNIYEYFCKVRKIALSESILNLPRDGKTYSRLLALTRLPERNVKMLYGAPTALKMLPEYNLDNCIDKFTIQCRYNAIALDNQFTMYAYNEVMKYSGYPSLHDPDGLNEISNKYYSKNPVDFLSLM